MDNKIRQRFEKFFTKSEGCWIWQGGIKGKYGAFWLGYNNASANRVAYELYVGKIPGGQIVRHTCDEPKCVNPAHLLLGTHQQNSDDCALRGRTASGSKNARAILTEKELHEIRDLLKSKLFVHRVISGWYAVSHSTVSMIACGGNWGKH